MISKATRSSSFGATVGYAVGKEDSEVLEMHNLLIENIDWRTATRLMAATASQARIERPAYHVSISWPEDEVPTDDQMRTVAARMLERLGLGEHQAVVVRHHNPGRANVHIVANRVHLLHGEEREDGTRNRVWLGWKDYAAREKILRNLEREMGFRLTPGTLHLQAGLPVPGLEQRVGAGDAPTVLPQGVMLPTGTAKAVRRADDWSGPRPRTARQLYRCLEKARAGGPRAQYAIGQVYEAGAGFSRDPGQALRWYRAAERQGHAGAAAGVRRLEALGRGGGMAAISPSPRTPPPVPAMGTGRRGDVQTGIRRPRRLLDPEDDRDFGLER